MFCVQNLGLFIGPMITGSIINSKVVGGNFRLVNLVQATEVFIALIFGILIWRDDATIGKGELSRNAKQAAAES